MTQKRYLKSKGTTFYPITHWSAIKGIPPVLEAQIVDLSEYASKEDLARLRTSIEELLEAGPSGGGDITTSDTTYDVDSVEEAHIVTYTDMLNMIETYINSHYDSGNEASY